MIRQVPWYPSTLTNSGEPQVPLLLTYALLKGTRVWLLVHAEPLTETNP